MVKVKVKAEGCEASWHMTAKPTGTQPPGGRKFGSDDLGREGVHRTVSALSPT